MCMLPDTLKYLYLFILAAMQWIFSLKPFCKCMEYKWYLLVLFCLFTSKLDYVSNSVTPFVFLWWIAYCHLFPAYMLVLVSFKWFLWVLWRMKTFAPCDFFPPKGCLASITFVAICLFFLYEVWNFYMVECPDNFLCTFFCWF